MVKLMNKILCINDIFETENNQYTKAALLYQDILRFPNDGGSTRYKFWQLGRWLIGNNNEFKADHGRNFAYSPKAKTTIQYAVQKKQDRIKSKIKDLVRAGLVRVAEKKKAEKVDMLIDIYENTVAGNLVSLIILRKKNGRFYDELYNLIMNSILVESNRRTEDKVSSGDTFIRTFIETCKERKVFVDLVDEFFVKRLELEGNDDRIYDASRLLHELINLRWFIEKSPDFIQNIAQYSYYELWKKAFEKLDEETRHLLLSRYKAIFETPMKYPDSRQWERKRYDSVSNQSKTVLIGNCYSCSKLHPLDLDTLTWLQKFFNSDMTLEGTCTETKKKTKFTIKIFS